MDIANLPVFLKTVDTGQIRLVLVIVSESSAQLPRVTPFLWRGPRKLVAAQLEPDPITRTLLLCGIPTRAKLVPGGVCVVHLAQWIAKLIDLGEVTVAFDVDVAPRRFKVGAADAAVGKALGRCGRCAGCGSCCGRHGILKYFCANKLVQNFLI